MQTTHNKHMQQITTIIIINDKQQKHTIKHSANIDMQKNRNSKNLNNNNNNKTINNKYKST